MQRVTITLDSDLIEELDRFMAARQYDNRSEAIRDLVRAGLSEVSTGEGADRPCVAALVYVFDHHRRDLANRLTHAHHDHHDLSLATTHVHLDHDRCLEVALLRGPSGEVRHFADHVMAERGVRHGRLVLVPAEGDEDSPPHRHDHGNDRDRDHGHGHD